MKAAFYRMSLPLRFTIGTATVLLLVLLIFKLVMQPQLADLGLMALFLSITSIITLLVGYLAYRLGWMSKAPSLRWAIFGTYVLSSLVTFINIWLTARLMFSNDHDLLLGTLLLVFASGIAVTLGYFFSETLTQRIQVLNATAGKIRHGGLDARVASSGRDEIAQLSDAFNAMLERLELAERRQQELDAARRDLIAWVGHDLQTPLASIRAIVEALADDMVDDPATRQRYLSTARKDIKALSHLIDDLFELSQLDAGGVVLDLQPSSLADLISDTLESFTAIARGRDISLQGEIRGEVDLVIMDVERIGRVLTNLVSNALQYTPREGQVHLIASRTEEGVCVSVTDNGEGFDPQDLPHLFDHFYRGEKSRSRATGGVGLGLAIAKGFVEAHGGSITAELVPEGGSRFTINLPQNAVSS